MKKILLTFLILLPLTAGAVWWNPTTWYQPKSLGLAISSSHQNLLPFQDSKYYLGTTSPSLLAWKGLIVDEICLAGDCQTTWSAGGGEANTGASLGTGLNIFDSKSGVVLRFNTLSAGSNITLSTTTNDNTIVISSSATGGSGVGTISTSTTPTVGHVPYYTSLAYPTLLGSVATSSVTINSPLTSAGTAGYVIGGSGWTIDIDDIKAADLDLTDITLNDFTNDAVFITAAGVPAAETDAAHDNCSEITGCVVGAITDGNTGWDNSYGFTTFGYPFPSAATTTILNLTNGFTSSALTQGFAYLGTGGKLNTIASSSINLSWLNNDSGFITSTYKGFIETGTTSVNSITALTNLSITKSQVSDFGTYDSVTTAGDGLTRTVNDFDCDTASGSVFGCLTSANWTTFNDKQAALVSGTNIKTINGSSILGSGDLTVSGSGSGLASTTPWTAGNLTIVSDNGHITSIASSSIKLSLFNNDAGFTTYAYPFPSAATTTILDFTNSFKTTGKSQGIGYIGSNGLFNTVSTSSPLNTAITGNAGTATALAANGSNCSAGSFPLGVDASGAVETCTDAWTEAENTSAAYTTVAGAMTGTFDGVDFGNGTLAQNALWVGGAAAIPSELTIGTGGYILGVSGGTPTWLATTSIPLAGDVTGTLSATVVGNDSHDHTATTISGLGVTDFTSANISQWTNDSGFTNYAYPFPSAATSTKLTLSGGLSTTYASTTGISGTYASSTFWHGGGLQTCDPTTGKLTWSGGVFSCGTDAGAGGGLSSYDAWTHPGVGQSATTSLLVLNNATSTLFSATTGWFTNLWIGAQTILTYIQTEIDSRVNATFVDNLFADDLTVDDDVPESGDFTNLTATYPLANTAGTLSMAISTSSIPHTMVAQYATSTWSGTTTVYLAPALYAGTVNGVYCDASAGTLWMSLYDGTNRANLVQASTTQGYYNYTTNNTFTAGEKIRVDFGTPASSPTQVSCRFKYTYTNY